MTLTRKTKEKWEFGDFQTPDALAKLVVKALLQLGINPASVIEPTCGKGSLLIKAMNAFPQAERFLGADINPRHLSGLRDRLGSEEPDLPIEILHADFFNTDWNNLLADFPQPILILGNPPWVTSSELSVLQSSNLPEKSNIHGRNGLEAVTGKSNFDISEWMILQHLSWLKGRRGAVAMLCKTAVARKVLTYSWKQGICIDSAVIFGIDARKYFDAAVDACLLVLQFKNDASHQYCDVFSTFASATPATTIGYQDGFLIADITTYQRLRHLVGRDKYYVWRSGIKHDCAKVMELTRDGSSFVNGKGVTVRLEDDFLYPLLKSSDIGNGRVDHRQKYMLVTQKLIGENTNKIKTLAPNTWEYLQENKEFLAIRGSSIYIGRPDFSIFGVGDYTFSPWKVAISGFYKRLNFVVVPPVEDKPVVFDDTVYFLSCSIQHEAEFIYGLLNSQIAKDFLGSMIFWDDKRPITIELLKRLDLFALSNLLGLELEHQEIVKTKGTPTYVAEITQLRLFERREPYQ